MERGYFLAFITVLLFGLLDGINRAMVLNFQADPWTYSCIQMFTGGLVLVAVGGLRHPELKKTFRHPYSWFIGLFRMGDLIFYVAALAYITATEAEFIARINVFIGILLAWQTHKRGIAKKDLPGLLLILVGVCAIVLRTPEGFMNPAILFMALAALSVTLQTYFIEIHPISNRSIGLKARATYTGGVLTITSLFLLLTAILVKTLHGQPLTFFSDSWPNHTNAFDTTVILCAGAIGITLRALVMYLSFLTIRLIKTDSYMMVLGLLPFATLGVESVFSFFGWLDLTPLDGPDIFYGTLISSGALWLFFNRMHNRQKA